MTATTGATQPNLITKSTRLVHGVGINDCLDDCKGEWRQVWADMLRRSFKLGRGATVCTSWLTASNFKQWYESTTTRVRATGYIGKLQLDKDLLCIDGLEYSPKTCTLLPPAINSLLSAVGCQVNNTTGYAGITYRPNLKAKPYSTKCVLDGKRREVFFGSPETAYAFRVGYLTGRFDTLVEVHKPMLVAQKAYSAMGKYCNEVTFINMENLEDMVNSVTH